LTAPYSESKHSRTREVRECCDVELGARLLVLLESSSA
jgi:hypothetical protein